MLFERFSFRIKRRWVVQMIKACCTHHLAQSSRLHLGESNRDDKSQRVSTLSLFCSFIPFLLEDRKRTNKVPEPNHIFVSISFIGAKRDKPCSPYLLCPRRRPILSICDIFLLEYEVSRSFLRSGGVRCGKQSE